VQGLVEVEMRGLVSKKTFREFEGQLQRREQERRKKRKREDKYSGWIEDKNNEKFEQQKIEANYSLPLPSDVPTVIRNRFYVPEPEEEKETPEEIK